MKTEFSPTFEGQPLNLKNVSCKNNLDITPTSALYGKGLCNQGKILCVFACSEVLKASHLHNIHLAAISKVQSQFTD